MTEIPSSERLAKVETLLDVLQRRIEDDKAVMDRRLAEYSANMDRTITNRILTVESKIDSQSERLDMMNLDLKSRIKHVDSDTRQQFASVEILLDKKIEEKDIHYIKLIVFGMVALILTAFGTIMINTIFHPINLATPPVSNPVTPT